MYCFWLASADVAVEADGRGDGNAGNYELGRFSVGWPEGPAPPPPGPTFEFVTVDSAKVLTELDVREGADTTYAIRLKNVGDDDSDDPEVVFDIPPESACFGTEVPSRKSTSTMSQRTRTRW